MILANYTNFPREVKSNYAWFINRLIYLLHTIEVNVAMHCNLNCAGCTHYSPISPKNFLDVHSYETNINKLAKKLPYPHIKEIRLLGGEPLLHKELGKIVEITRHAYPKAAITIVTNGLLVKKMSDNLINTICDNEAWLTVTRYPIDIDYDAIIDFIKSKNINTFVYNDICINDFTYDLLDIDGPYNPKKNFKNCRCNNCMQLVDEKIYICPYSAFYELLNKKFLDKSIKKFKGNKEDYLLIDDIHNPMSFYRYITKYKPFCKYCALDKQKQHKWQRTNFAASEWIVDD